MAKKKKSKIPQSVKIGLIGLCVVVGGFVIVSRTVHAFKTIEYFNIKSVVIDPSLQFINKRDLRGVLGKNIFAVDIRSVQRQLSRRYPQASELKVNRQFPNQISVVAKKRNPIAQIQIQNQIAVLDKEGVILSLLSKKNKDLPNLIGVKMGNPRLTLGLPLRGSGLAIALRIIDLYMANENLQSAAITDVNIENLSQIHCTLANDIDIIIDRYKMEQKIRVLGAVLAQDNLDLNNILYIDLRFKDPLIKKKQ